MKAGGECLIDITPLSIKNLPSFYEFSVRRQAGDLGVADGVIQGRDRRRDEKNGGKMKITAKKVARFRKKQ